jgi:hypothetical protein
MMPAPRHQIGEPDLIDFTQVILNLQPNSHLLVKSK